MPSPRPTARTGWLTLLDAALLVAAAAALVTLLGARARLDLAGLRITIRSATNLLLISASLAALRAWLGGRTRVLPAVDPGDARPFDLERRRLADPEPLSPRVLAFAAAAVIGSLVWIWPHLLHPRSVPDFGDPLFSAWRIARIAHQLAFAPAHLFDGNIFYPLPHTLTLSDSTFLQALLGAPFVLAGADPLVVANVLTIVAFPACALAFFYAAWRITGSPDAALIAALLGAWHPFHGEHYSHLELQWVMFAPLAIVTGLQLLAAPGVRRGGWFGAAVAAQWLASMYLGVMLVSVLLPLLVVASIAWRIRPSRQAAIAFATAGAIAFPAFVMLAWPYAATRGLRGERARQEVLDGSATGDDYRAPNGRLVTYARRGQQHHLERELFPGTSTVALAAAGVVPPLTAASLGILVAGALAFDWSLGLNGLTYDDLYKISPVHRGMRMTARFSAVVGVALALLGGLGAARLLRRIRTPTLRASACAGLAIAVLLDLRLDLQLEEYPVEIPAIYASVTPGMVLAELPVDRQIDYMYFSTRHWAHLLGGYSGYPKYSSTLMEGWQAWPSPAAIDLFRRAGATHVTYNCALEDRPLRCATALDVLDNHPQLEPIASALWEGKQTRLYRIK